MRTSLLAFLSAKGTWRLPSRSSTQSPGLSWILLAALALLGGVAPAMFFGGTDYGYNFLIAIIVWTGLAVTWNSFSGQTGYFSLGHAAFFGAGAYSVAILHPLVGPWVALALSVVAPGILGLIFGLVTLRLRGLFFTVATIGIAEALRLTVMIMSDFTGGGTGLTFGDRPAYSTLYFVALPILILVIGVTILTAQSVTGRRLIAIRDDEEALGAVGIAVNRRKIFSFATSVATAGLFGGIYALQIGYVQPDAIFPLLLSLTVVIMCMLGGVGMIWGPVVGTVVLWLVRESVWLNYPSVWDIVLGVALIVIVLVLPAGLVGMLKRHEALKGFLL